MQAIYAGIVAVRPLAVMAIALSFAGCVAGAPRDEQTDGAVAVLGIDVAPSCSSDVDCRLVPDYCSECACVALRAQQPQDECLGEELKCVINPCEAHVAICIDGRCSAESGASR